MDIDDVIIDFCEFANGKGIDKIPIPKILMDTFAAYVIFKIPSLDVIHNDKCICKNCNEEVEPLYLIEETCPECYYDVK